MIILPTKKFSDFIGVKQRLAPLPEFANPDACWFGNIIVLNRKKGLLLTHEPTRYSIFIYGLTKKDLKNLHDIIVSHLKYHLFEDKFTLKQMEYLLSISENFSYFKKTDRKVTGTMNNMSAILYHHFKTYENINDKELTKKLNSMLFKINDEYQHPVELMKEYIAESLLIRELE